jgi:hypothetical protein
MSPEHIKKAPTAGAEPDGGSGAIVDNLIDTPQSFARAADNSETENNDTPKYIPPRCLHNPSKSALKCEQCSIQYREGKLE